MSHSAGRSRALRREYRVACGCLRDNSTCDVLPVRRTYDCVPVTRNRNSGLPSSVYPADEPNKCSRFSLGLMVRRLSVDRFILVCGNPPYITYCILRGSFWRRTIPTLRHSLRQPHPLSPFSTLKQGAFLTGHGGQTGQEPFVRNKERGPLWSV
eukprot:scaffold392631_cov47-Attheya_sp.AAC.1